MSNLATALLESATAVARLGVDAAAIGALDDRQLVAGQRAYVAHQRTMETYGAMLAGEIARRSAYGFGHDGLSRREGFSTPEGFIQSISGSTFGEASKLVKVGTMMADAAAAEAMRVAEAAQAAAVAEAEAAALRASEAARIAGTPVPDFVPPPVVPLRRVPVSPDAAWQAPIVAEVAAGTLSLDQANGIRRGLGTVGDGVSALTLLGAVLELLAPAVRGNTTQLNKLARQLRDRLDIAGVARRETDRRAMQYLTASLRDDGMVVGSFAFAGKDGALIWDAYLQAVGTSKSASSSRTNSDPSEDGSRARSGFASALDDNRTPRQKAADYFVNLIQIGIDADPATMTSSRRPSVRVIVEESTLVARYSDPTADKSSGAGHVDGMLDAVSLAAIEAALCDTGTQGIQFDNDGQCLDLGRDIRLFNRKQKVVLVVRDGGCRCPGCDKPPSWTEAHHINFWSRDKGKTDVADGILLCRFHHGLFHSKGWEITRDGGQYWLTPPKSIDPTQARILMPSNTLAVRKITERNRSKGQQQQIDGVPTGASDDIITMAPVPSTSGADNVRFVASDTLWDDPID